LAAKKVSWGDLSIIKPKTTGGPLIRGLRVHIKEVLKELYNAEKRPEDSKIHNLIRFLNDTRTSNDVYLKINELLEEVAIQVSKKET
jgi:uncharacterized protein (DUF433 family)